MKRHPLNCLLLIVPVFLCAAVLLMVSIYFTLPEYTNRSFGPPAQHLDPIQRLYLSALLVADRDALVTARNPQGSLQTFEVVLGEPASSVVQRLEQEGLIKNAEAFRHYLVYSGLDTSIQAGEYSLSPAMTGLEIARRLQDPTPSHVEFPILAGWRLEEIAAALPTSGLGFSPQEFLMAAKAPFNGFTFNSKLPAGATLEGFFFPDRYQFPRTVTIDEFIQTILDHSESKITPALQQGFNRQSLDIYQAVTLASMVQREAMTDDEMPDIASVFLNRLHAGMKLDSDPTVQYSLGYNTAQKTWWTNPLSLDDLKFNSPYNTYLSSGLPPGPISNPGLAALNAIAFPADTPYYYFRAACDGSGRHTFAKTLEEQMSNACP